MLGSARRPALHMDWDNLCFLHWEVEAAPLQAMLPPGLELDTFAGRAYLGLVPFTMHRIRYFGLPAIPGFSAFHECNVRTYVRKGAQRGVWFFSLDAADRLAVFGARRLWSLPYFHAEISLQREGARTHYRCRRRRSTARLHCSWEAGDPLPPAQPDSLEHFLTERYLLFSWRRGRLLKGRVSHPPWPLQQARLLDLDDSLIRAADLPQPNGPALCWHAEHLEAQAFPLEPVH